ncbi:MAG TPA: hypothetical protein VGM50_14425 [Gemmatimonadaceae bacterium]
MSHARPLYSRAIYTVCVLLAAALPLRAQSAQLASPPIYEEYRIDAIANRDGALEAGAGITIPAGIYVRFAVDGAAGATWRDGGTRGSGRVDGIARFTLDPFREIPFALSLGGGVSVPYVAGDAHVRPLLAAVIDLEGRRHGNFTPAIQLGLGGGARIGFVLRTSAQRWR